MIRLRDAMPVGGILLAQTNLFIYLEMASTPQVANLTKLTA
jgi:hypothetical protein